MNNSFYFDHDYNARNDSKILELRAEYGWVGYGLFFAILESLCEAKGHLKREALAGLSLGLSYPKPELLGFLDFCLNVGLFEEDENGIFSGRILEHLEYRQKLSAAGRLGGRGNKATLKPPFSQVKATSKQERKGKERKEEDSKEERNDKDDICLPDKNWKTDFETYKSELRKAFEELRHDKDWIIKQERYHPGVDILMSIEKACVNYWSTEAGWSKKKKSRIAVIDWKATLTNAIDLNKVYKPKDGNKNELPEQSAASIADDVRRRIHEQKLRGGN